MGTEKPLAGQVALVAGATRGAGRGIARALGAAGAMVYCTGRSSTNSRLGMNRPETIEETAAQIQAKGGKAIALQVDHTNEEAVAGLVATIREQAQRLDILVNCIWGADPLIDWPRRFWEANLANIRPFIDQTLLSHLMTCRHAVPLMIEANRGLIVEVVDGHLTGYRGHILYDLVKASLVRLAYGMAMELMRTGVTALSLSPGFLRSEAVLEHFGVTEKNWQEAIQQDPYFAESESPLLIGRAVVALAADPGRKAKAGLTLFASDLAREYSFTDTDGQQPNFPQLFDRKMSEIVGASSLEGENRFFAWSRYCQIHKDPTRRDLALGLAKVLGLNELGPGTGVSS